MSAPAPTAPSGGPKRKREKIAGACTACRHSKVKCEDARPCTRCISHGWHNSCESWRHIEPRRRKQCRGEAELVDLLTAAVPPPLPPSLAAQSLFGGPPAPHLPHVWGLPHGGLGALFALAEVRPASEPWPVRQPPPGPSVDSERGALCEADSDTELSGDENDDFWQSVEHLKAIPIAFDRLPYGALGALSAEVRPASEPWPVRRPPPGPSIDSERGALCEADSDTELSGAENDDFWRSVEHLKAIPIAFDRLL